MKSPGRRASKLGKFKPTLIPLPPKLPSDVGELMASMNRKERRGFAVKARAHARRHWADTVEAPTPESHSFEPPATVQALLASTTRARGPGRAPTQTHGDHEPAPTLGVARAELGSSASSGAAASPEEPTTFEVGPLFHVTDARSLFGAGPPVGFICPGEGCPACAADRENAKSAATITVARVDRELGTFTAKTP
jgi:hypothetical protein